jgi:RimJ/RimL family protein N-acetyltransferase
MTAVPTLQTQRLTLRPMVAADFPAYAAMMASPRTAFMGGPFGTQPAWFAFCHDIASWTLFGHGGLMIDRRDTGETVGQVGINAGPLFPETELGWLIYQGHERQGFATEAASALRDWAFAALPYDSLVSYTHPENHGSQAVARRMGALLDPVAVPQDEGDLVWRHQRGAA